MRPTLCRRIAMAVLAAGLAPGTVAVAAEPMDCRVEEPDSVQISWDSPCQTGDWLLDTELGCRTWDWHPTPDDGATWTGACRSGAKSGHGVVQWFEHGRRSTASRGPSSRGGVRATGSTAGTRPTGSRAPTRTIYPTVPGRRILPERPSPGSGTTAASPQIAGSSRSAWRARHVTIRRRIRRSAVRLAFRVRSGARRSSRALLWREVASGVVVAGSAPRQARRFFFFGRHTNFQRGDERFPGKSRSGTSKVTNSARAARSLWAMAGDTRLANSAFSRRPLPVIGVRRVIMQCRAHEDDSAAPALAPEPG
jgi:hypothetical protein